QINKVLSTDDTDELDDEDDEDSNVGSSPVTEQIVDPKIKIKSASDHDIPEESIDPNWNRNLAIRDVAYYLRAHKFSDYDHRYYKKIEDSPHRLYEEFPKPPLRSLHWEVHKYCDDGFIKCLKYLDNTIRSTSLRRVDDTITVIKDNHWNISNNNAEIIAIQTECQTAQQRDNLTFVPFQGPIERFQWRTSASYYMCWYTMLEISELSRFGESCDNHANCLDVYGVNNKDPRADDSKPFACALYSFCPDHCCPMKHIWYLRECFQNINNPCYEINQPGHRKCTLNHQNNQNFNALMSNQLNVSCDCHTKGYEWSSKFGLCIDINECARGLHNCTLENGESCFNLPGSFQCVCGFGLIRNKQLGRCMISDTFKRVHEILEPHVNDTHINNILSTIVDTLTRSSANNFHLFPGYFFVLKFIFYFEIYFFFRVI
ncbi:protein kinase C-binding protein NELL2-like, partial [Aphidius gifuensis]|uniref:protein kinase C-binding protein NELL2-like n=1 Tax=Aphidius gifuensis TaxID=684658 RepID=UPI001CDC7AEB